VVFHPECARKAHFNLSLDYREIFCSEHRKELRLLLIERYNASRRGEIMSFADNLKACYEHIDKTDSVEARALAQLEQ